MERRIVVLVGGNERVVSTISWSDTAEDVIRRLVPQSKSSSPHILLETWGGCSRMIRPRERVMNVLDGWGFGCQDEPLLQLIKKSSSKLYKSRRTKRRYHCCKVAARKRDPPTPLQPRSKKAKMRDILTIIRRLRKQLLDYRTLTAPNHPSQKKVSFPVDISSLPPELEDDFAALQEALIEEEREEADLQRRKEELTGNILSQERELGTLKTSISTLEAKVKNEEHKKLRLIETTGPPELEGAQKEVAKLQNDLSVRIKLNKLQVSKLQEVNNNVSKVEQEIEEVNKKIATLRLETHL
ncbi:uncharacterized protein LOC135346333 [Halichondria panicea]|uniref:uncharacterized protein LOC135346333 n=1 Tax=Halichondria panicea TaxID=6063 RepID=UPI00312BB8AF